METKLFDEKFQKRPLIILLIIIFTTSVVTNYYGNNWGAPVKWHPDELTDRATSMVERHSLNPEVFHYGGLHYLTISAFAVIPAKIWSKLFDRHDVSPDKMGLRDRDQRLRALTMVLARTISAVMAACIVLFTFWLGKLFFDEWVGLLAAVFLTLSCHFVTIAHFATVDTAANFWFWLSCLMAALLWKRDEKIWYVLAFLFSGFAFGAKIDRLIIILPLLLAHLFRCRGIGIKLLIKHLPLLLIGYVIANPTLIFSPFEFLDGTFRDLFFNVLRGKPGSTFYTAALQDINKGLGTPLLFSALLGICFIFHSLLKQERILETIWLIATILPYYFIFSLHQSQVWYVPIYFPVLTIFAAFGWIALFRVANPKLNIALLAILLLVIGYSALYTTAMVNQFTNDSRYIAAQWIAQHIPHNTTILRSPRGPEISSTDFTVVKRPDNLNYNSYEFAKQGAGNLTEDETYQKIHERILELESMAAKVFGNTEKRHAYRAWFDRVAKPEREGGAKVMDWNGLLNQHFDYIILVDYLDEYINKILSSEHSQYQLLKTFHYDPPFKINVEFPFVNPHIFIFQSRTPNQTRNG